MSWEPQGLIKYECRECNKQFIVGLIDDKQTKPIHCPFCMSQRITDVVYAEPYQDYSKYLEDMGCMGIDYDPEQAYLEAERAGMREG